MLRQNSVSWVVRFGSTRGEGVAGAGGAAGIGAGGWTVATTTGAEGTSAREGDAFATAPFAAPFSGRGGASGSGMRSAMSGHHADRV